MLFVDVCLCMYVCMYVFVAFCVICVKIIDFVSSNTSLYCNMYKYTMIIIQEVITKINKNAIMTMHHLNTTSL